MRNEQEATSKKGRAYVRGYGGDTFGIYGVGLDIDDDDCAQGTVREIVIRQQDGAGLVIHGRHGERGTGCGWRVSVRPLDEDRPFARSMSMRQDGHSMILEVDLAAGDHVTLRPLPKK